MNLRIALCVSIPLLFFSCTNKKNKNSSQIVENKISTHYVYGTYEGILEKNDKSQYVLLALDSVGKYELYEKEIGAIGSSFYKGSVTTHLSNEVLTLELGEELTIQLDGESLKSENLKLSLVSEKQQLNAAYYTFMIKENSTGNNYAVAIYAEDGVEYADFEFNGEKYKLAVNEENSQEIEFTNGTEQFWWNIIDPAPLANYQPVFYDGKNKYNFMLLNPTNVFYKAKTESAPITMLDVLYFIPQNEESFVKILSNNPTYCYELKQIESPSKTGTYQFKEIVWSTNTKNEALLGIGRDSYMYTEVSF